MNEQNMNINDINVLAHSQVDGHWLTQHAQHIRAILRAPPAKAYEHQVRAQRERQARASTQSNSTSGTENTTMAIHISTPTTVDIWHPPGTH